MDSAKMDNEKLRERVLTHSMRRAIAVERGQDLARWVKANRDKHYADPESVQQRVNLACALLEAGRIMEDAFVFFAAQPVESLHEHRWPEIEAYPEVQAISSQMREIEMSEGLADGYYWLKEDAPPEWLALSGQIDVIVDEEFAKTLEKFGLPELAKMWRSDREHFDTLREKGRLSVFEKDNVVASILHSIQTYEDEAALCGEARAYYSASVMLGSATEGRLLLLCLTNPNHVKNALSAIPAKDAPRNSNPLHWSFEHLIRVTDKCGWLQAIEDESIFVNVSSYLVHLMDTRNLLHPGRHARQMPHVNIGEEAYKDARIAYDALRCCLNAAGFITPEPVSKGSALIAKGDS